MFTRINPNTQPVQLYPKVERELSTVKKKGWVKVNGAKLRDNNYTGHPAENAPLAVAPV